MTLRNYIDNSPTTNLTAPITSGATSATVSSLVGFPTSFPFAVTLGAGTSSAEVVLVTAAVGSTVTITRNYDGQGAFSHPVNETFDHTAVAKDFQEANAHVNASQNVHGLNASSAVVGTTDAQTLTNKTLSAPTIATITNGGFVAVPTGPDTLVGRASTDTLTNKTLDATTTIDGTAVSSVPRGTVARAAKTSGTVSPTSTETLITGLNDISMTAVAGRRYKITVSITGLMQSSASAGDFEFRIRDGGASAPTTASTLLIGPVVAIVGTALGNGSGFMFVADVTGLSAGVHRLGLSVLSVATGPNMISTGTTLPLLVLVEDIGV